MRSKRKCARWCGAGCTQAEYDAAVRAARALVKECGPGFEPEVWENMGWHYKAVSKYGGHLQIHKRPNSYTAFLGDGDGGGRWVANSRSIVAAIRKVMTMALKDHDEMADIIYGATVALGVLVVKP